MMRLSLMTLLLLFISVCRSANPGDCLPNAATAPGYCAKVWASGLSKARGILVLPNNDVLVVESKLAQISLFYETSNQVNKVKLAGASGLNHGIAYGDGYLYASSPTTVYRWPYTVGTRKTLGTPQTVITNIPGSGHNTRTLVYNDGTLIVSVGSNGNVDKSGQAGVYSFKVSDFPTTFDTKTVIASGVRNEVGLRFDPQGRIWGVENGFDDLFRSDLGGDIHQQNPGEEVNLFDMPGKFYGYPFCWSQYNLTTVSTPFLTQYAHPDFVTDGTHSDAWCQNPANVVLPKYSIRAHTAPLDIIFYTGSQFPATNDAFISSHGSWDRTPAAGYDVVHLKFSNGMPVSDTIVLAYKGPGETASSWIRPVGLAWYNCSNQDCLLVTDDSAGFIVSISYDNSCSCNAPTITPTSGTGTAVASTTGTSTGTASAAAVPFYCMLVLAFFLLL
eukprot:Phypoly_transcript_08061.p1 GENE.Phypoly_transcript_08061~~Phypoly_transcript_08061.p1  ORF type:complete len:445 (+),score=44.38 Phypoly_transcript_08061:186-1520(+)